MNLTSQSGFTIQFLMELVGEYDGAVGERSNMSIFLGVSLSVEYIFFQRISKKGVCALFIGPESDHCLPLSLTH